MENRPPQISALDMLEADARSTLSEKLVPLLSTTEWILKNGPYVTQFTKGKPQTSVGTVQIMLLKQALTFLRSGTVLLLSGYTAPAAAVACSLYELYLYSDYIFDSEERAKEYLSHTNSQEFVWRPAKMIRHSAEQEAKRSEGSTSFEEALSMFEFEYTFLCALKHANPIPARHLSLAHHEGLKLDGAVIRVWTMPDTRPEDLTVKVGVLTQMHSACFMSYAIL